MTKDHTLSRQQSRISKEPTYNPLAAAKGADSASINDGATVAKRKARVLDSKRGIRCKIIKEGLSVEPVFEGEDARKA